MALHECLEGKPNVDRIWVCDECYKNISDDEARYLAKADEGWARPCLALDGTRCEAHWTPYVPEERPYTEGRLVEMTDEVREAWERFRNGYQHPDGTWDWDAFNADRATIDRHFGLGE
jgi:hypothetical protein